MSRPLCKGTAADSHPAARAGRTAGGAPPGSILLAALLVCLGCSVLVLSLNAVMVAGLRAAHAERAGRAGEADAEVLLEELRQAALLRWEPQVLSREDGARAGLAPLPLPSGPPAPPVEAPFLAGTVEVPDAVYEGRLVEARRFSGLLERGWDGPDLPPVAVLARSVVPAADRTTPGILTATPEGVAEVPVATQFRPAEFLGMLGWTELMRAWHLDEGTRGWLADDPGCAGGVDIEQGQEGTLVPLRIPPACGGPDSPVMLVTTEAGVIDARNLGEVWGVVVGAEDILLDGTTLHGAVFCTGDVQLGHTGCVVYEERVRLWATDHSLYRVRLVPGTRVEEWLEAAP